jgi:hypothetical protein
MDQPRPSLWHVQERIRRKTNVTPRTGPAHSNVNRLTGCALMRIACEARHQDRRGRDRVPAGALASGPMPEVSECARSGRRTAMEFKRYRRKQIAELRPYVPGESVEGISISQADRDAGSPKQGDMIARNPKNHADQWLVSAQYFHDNFEPVT